MEACIELITPKLARELLAQNRSNRPLVNSVVAKYIGSLRRGEWKVTHQGIAIGIDGRLLDGQHRLTAIAESGISASLLVAKGLSDDVFDVLDTGRARKGSDVLAIKGAKNAKSVAAAIRLYVLYGKAPGQWIGKSVASLVSNSVICAQYKVAQDTWDWCMSTAVLAAPVMVSSSFACCLRLALDHGYSETYLSGLANRAKRLNDLPQGHPILAYARRSRDLKLRQNTQERLADYIKLLNKLAAGESMAIFKQSPISPMPRLTAPFFWFNNFDDSDYLWKDAA